MKFSFEQATTLAPNKIWHYYADVNKWFTWEGDLEEISLAGEFKQGTKGKMKLTGQPAMDFVLESVILHKEFIDRTSIPGLGNIYFSHQLREKGEQTIISHSVEFVPNGRAANRSDLQFVSGVFADVADSVFDLEKAVRNNG